MELSRARWPNQHTGERELFAKGYHAKPDEKEVFRTCEAFGKKKCGPANPPPNGEGCG